MHMPPRFLNRACAWGFGGHWRRRADVDRAVLTDLGRSKVHVVLTAGERAWRLSASPEISPSVLLQRHCKDWTTQLWWGYRPDAIAASRYSHYISSFSHRSQGKILKFRILEVSWWCVHKREYIECMHLNGTLCRRPNTYICWEHCTYNVDTCRTMHTSPADKSESKYSLLSPFSRKYSHVLKNWKHLLISFVSHQQLFQPRLAL